MGDRVLLAIGAGAIALSLIGPAVQATVFDSPATGWGGFGHMGEEMMDGWWGESGTTGTIAPVEGASKVEITIRDFEIVPSDVRIPAGEAVNLTIRNQGAAPHDFTIPDLGIHVVVAPGQAETVGLTASIPGTYETLCTVPGHANLGMVGVLIVERSE